MHWVDQKLSMQQCVHGRPVQYKYYLSTRSFMMPFWRQVQVWFPQLCISRHFQIFKVQPPDFQGTTLLERRVVPFTQWTSPWTVLTSSQRMQMATRRSNDTIMWCDALVSEGYCSHDGRTQSWPIQMSFLGSTKFAVRQTTKAKLTSNWMMANYIRMVTNDI